MREKFPSRKKGERNSGVSGKERRGFSRVCGFRGEESGSGIESGSGSGGESEGDEEEEMGDTVVPERWDVLGLGQAMVCSYFSRFFWGNLCSAFGCTQIKIGIELLMWSVLL